MVDFGDFQMPTLKTIAVTKCCKGISSAVDCSAAGRLLLASLAAILTLQGCGFSKQVFYEPKAIDFTPSRGRDLFFRGEQAGCGWVPNFIFVPIGGGASMKLSAEQGVYSADKTWLDAPGTTLIGKLYVPSGAEVRFVTPVFTVLTASGERQVGTVTQLKRDYIYPRRDESMSNQDIMVGRAIDEDNLFEFFIPLKEFSVSAFTVQTPEMEVNGRTVPARSISFRHVEKTHFVSTFEALCV